MKTQELHLGEAAFLYRRGSKLGQNTASR